MADPHKRITGRPVSLLLALLVRHIFWLNIELNYSQETNKVKNVTTE